jgi:hypothetical protein
MIKFLFRIHIQTNKFKFKWTNQKLTAHYRPSAPVAGGSAGGTVRTLPPSPTPMRAIPPGLDGRYPYRPIPLSHFPRRTVAPGHWTVMLSGRALPPATGTSLTARLGRHREWTSYIKGPKYLVFNKKCT